MLGKLSGENETDGGLDLAGGHGDLPVVLDQAACLAGDATEGVGHEGVQDGHGSLGDSGVRVDLLENAVDVDVVGLASPALVLLSLSASWASHLEVSCFLVLETVIE